MNQPLLTLFAVTTSTSTAAASAVYFIFGFKFFSFLRTYSNICWHFFLWIRVSFRQEKKWAESWNLLWTSSSHGSSYVNNLLNISQCWWLCAKSFISSVPLSPPVWTCFRLCNYSASIRNGEKFIISSKSSTWHYFPVFVELQHWRWLQLKWQSFHWSRTFNFILPCERFNWCC